MHARNERGVVFPSPVVVLSVIAVAMAAVAFVFTRDTAPTEREITTVAVPSATPTTAPPSAEPTAQSTQKPRPQVQRSKIYVVVFNNSGITGLAGQVAQQASQIGWQVVGSDNWYGTIPTSTVYYPAKLERSAKLLALDLGIQRTAPAVDPMRDDRLTVILTGPLD